jgi:hypothetical protein
MSYILCEFEWKRVTKMQTVTAWPTPSEEVERFFALILVKDLFEITVAEDDPSSQEPMRSLTSQILETL